VIAEDRQEVTMAHTYAALYSDVKRLDSVVVLKPHGDLIGGPETDELEALIDQLDSESTTCLVINLAAVAIMNSLALSRLIRGHMRFVKRGAHVRLCSLDKHIESIFDVTKLSRLLPAYPDESMAIAGCAGGPQ